MQTEPGKETARESAPSISADFFTGSTEIGLDRIRTRLLDLTNRNKLLNYRHSNVSSLRVVDVTIDTVFARLRDNEKLAFLPVPEPEFDGPERSAAKDYATELGWNASFDLHAAADDGANSLPVLHYQEQLDTVSRKIASAARTAVEESGTNMLYLVFGFLEWYESDDSEQPRLAPLVVVPVTIERTGGKGKAVETILEYSGEDIQTNLSLVEKMRRDFGLEMPLLGEEDTPESYFRELATILELKKRWSIRRHITLALLSFGKLLMYRDLDPKTWPIAQSIAKHPLVRELFEGSKNPNITLAEEYDIDAPELKKDIPHLIRDADSSQHSALVHALRGQNLVIEGPPGTGKSQTITNLIAAALARGKTVLFVSEKLAALEVVRRRLDDAGLGMFCLEVHSHKTKKGALLNDIAQRHQMRGSFRDPRDLDGHLSVVEEKKQLLTRYAALINKTVEPFKATIFEILWARERCGQDIAAHQQRLAQVILPVVVRFTRVQFTQTEQFLSVYAQHLATVLAPCNSIERHPWAWISKPLGFEEEERVLDDLAEFLTTVRKADDCCDHLQEIAGITVVRTLSGFEHCASMLALLPEPRGTLLGDLLAPCRIAANRHLLAGFVEQVESFRRGYEHLSSSASNVDPLLDPQTADNLYSALDSLRPWGLEGHYVAEIRELLKTGLDAARLLQEGHSSFRVLLNIVGCEVPAVLTSTSFLLETVRIVENLPFDRLHFRHPEFEAEGAGSTLQTARACAFELKAAEASLGQEFDVALARGTLTAEQLLEWASVLSEASVWQRLFGADYRRAVKAYRRIALRKKKAPRIEMSQALRTVAEYAQKRTEFDSHARYRELFGAHFQGVNTPWDDLHQVILWYEQVFVALPDHQVQSEPFRKLVFTARVERLKAIKANIDFAQEHRAALSQVVSCVTKFTRAVPSERSLAMSGSFDEVLAGC